MRIFVFGDSITHGIWDPAGGWVQRIRAQYDKHTLTRLESVKTYPDVYNLGVSGDTVEGVAKRLAIEVKARSWYEEPVIVVAAGMNDTMIYKDVETNTPELFKGELQQIIAAARQFTSKMLFVGMNAVDEALCNPWKFSPDDIRFNNERILLFEHELRNFCKEADVPIVKVFEKFQGKRIEENVLADGLHPNEAGHQLIAELVKPVLDTLIT